jgi:hypothetical protein
VLSLLNNVSPSSGQYDIVLLTGLGIFFGTIGAKLSYHLYVKFEMRSVLMIPAF